MIFHDKKLTKPSLLSCGLNSQRMEKSSTASSAFRQQFSISGIKLASGSTARHRSSKFQETDDRYVSSFSSSSTQKNEFASHIKILQIVHLLVGTYQRLQKIFRNLLVCLVSKIAKKQNEPPKRYPS